LFAIVAIPFDAFQALPCPKSRWLLTCFSRYVDREGKAFPTLRQLARDARMSLASVSRYMTAMEQLGVFQRERKPGGRYRYTLAESYRPRWPGRVPAVDAGVPRAATQQANPAKYVLRTREQNDSIPWANRVLSWRRSGGRFWNDFWGPRPDQPGCWAPAAVLSAALDG
jgi:DNA-binding transcriptional MocR family regulator